MAKGIDTKRGGELGAFRKSPFQKDSPPNSVGEETHDAHREQGEDLLLEGRFHLRI